MITSALLSALAILGAAGAGAAADETGSADGAPGSVLAILSSGGDDFIAELEAAVEAHLSGFDASVSPVDVEEIPSSFPAQADLARAVADRTGAFAVAWADEEHSTFFVMIRDELTQGRFVERRLPENRSDWSAAADGIASMIHSSLLPTLESMNDSPETGETAEESGTSQQAKDEENPFEDPPIAPEEAPEPVPVAFVAAAGYGMDVLNGNGGFQHGARINVGTIIARHLELLVSADFLAPIDAQGDTEGADDIRLTRWPLRFRAGGFLTLSRFDLGIRLGVLVDFLEVKGLEETDFVAVRESETRRINPGFTAGLLLRGRILSWLFVWLEGTVDLMEWAYNFHMNATSDASIKTVVIEYGGIHAGFMAGLGIRLGPR